MLTHFQLSSLASRSAQTEAGLNASQQNESHEAEIHQAASDFETAFIAQMLTFSGLDKALTLGGGEDVSAFSSFYIESLAAQISDEGGFGLAEKFYTQLAKSGDLPAPLKKGL